jgi:SAM-dependent methyltransferase
MRKEAFPHYRQELEFQRKVWLRKRSLRKLYHHWYAKLVSCLSVERPVVEIGSGCGNFKAYCPEIMATDVSRCGDWIDLVLDARSLLFHEEKVGNFLLIDCLHHLPRPLCFLRAAGRALKPGGRIVMLEPAMTLWARFIWKNFHHENFDLEQDVFAENVQPEPENGRFLFSNTAIPMLLFVEGKQKLKECMPELSLTLTKFSDFVVYPATGGFSYFNFVPAGVLPMMLALEARIMRPLAHWLTGMRMLVVLEKSPSPT